MFSILLQQDSDLFQLREIGDVQDKVVLRLHLSGDKLPLAVFRVMKRRAFDGLWAWGDAPGR
jgi:hypothetical protein